MFKVKRSSWLRFNFKVFLRNIFCVVKPKYFNKSKYFCLGRNINYLWKKTYVDQELMRAECIKWQNLELCIKCFSLLPVQMTPAFPKWPHLLSPNPEEIHLKIDVSSPLQWTLLSKTGPELCPNPGRCTGIPKGAKLSSRQTTVASFSSQNSPHTAPQPSFIKISTRPRISFSPLTNRTPGLSMVWNDKCKK